MIPSAPRLLTSGEPRAGGLLRHRVASVATKKRKNKKNKNQKNTKGEGVNPRERRWRERRPIWRHERWIRTGQSSLLLASGGDYEGHAKGVRDPGLGLAGARGQFHSECGSDLISERALWPRCKTCALLRLNLQTLNNISSQAIKISKFFLFPIHHYLLTRNRNEHFCRGNLKRKNIYIYIYHTGLRWVTKLLTFSSFYLQSSNHYVVLKLTRTRIQDTCIWARNVGDWKKNPRFQARRNFRS